MKQKEIPEPRKVSVTERALVQRINRSLRKRHEKLVKARGDRTRLECGDFYTVGTRSDYITRTRVNLEDFARELNILHGYEEIR